MRARRSAPSKAAEIFGDVVNEALRSNSGALTREMEQTRSERGGPTSDGPGRTSTKCPRNYSAACPAGWQLSQSFGTSSSGECVAPQSYAGPCATRLALVRKSPAERAATERDCGLQWPCLDPCERDRSALCPEGWQPGPGNLCRPPASFAGDCAHATDFTHFTAADKEQWEVSCGGMWPCKSDSACPVRDYGAPCPSDWQFDAARRLCLAPAAYAGDCGPEENFDALATAPLRQLFEKRCNALFPCDAADAEGGGAGGDAGGGGAGAAGGTAAAGTTSAGDCAFGRDFALACPRWFAPNLKSGFCEPLYLSLDEPIRITAALEARRAYAEKHLLLWPCKQPPCEGPPQYADPCPAAWALTADGLSCRAPAGYAGPCAGLKAAADLSSDARKQAFARNCQVHWPCPGAIELGGRGVAPAGGPRTPGGAEDGGNLNGPIDPQTGVIAGGGRRRS